MNTEFQMVHSPKYGITEQRSGYKGIMRLTIRSFSPTDVGTYHCVSTNSLGRAEGTLRLYGKFKILLLLVRIPKLLYIFDNETFTTFILCACV